MWKIGPECVAQQKKFASISVTNCGERTAWPTLISDCASSVACVCALGSRAGGRRTSSAAGIISTAAMPAMICIDVRQSWIVTSQAASGAIVIGAMPMPAETSETARPRWVSNQPVTQAIIGAKTAAVAAPTRRPKSSWNSTSELAWLASARLAARTIEPVSTTGRGP